MKKIIDGRTYNTNTATWLCSGEHGSMSEFDWYVEDLYRTKRGAYFIYGYGHANSPYAAYIGQHMWSPGDGWRVLTEKDAKSFVEENGSVDDYIKIFGEPEEA